jgi:hypothetical protein
MVEAIEKGTKNLINSVGIIFAINLRIKEKHAKSQ